MNRSETEDSGAELQCFTLKSGAISLKVMNFGCTITNLFVPDRQGNPVDVLLGYDTFDQWQQGTEAHNALVGRVANRIAGGKFTLEGKTFLLDVNNGPNCLHSGNNRFEKMYWHVVEASDHAVHFRRISRALEQGFPGNVSVDVWYRLTDAALVLEYNAQTDRPTPLNLTNHAYFNLAGKGTVLNHVMCLDCQQVLEIDDTMIPTGKLLSVKGTPFDFTSPKPVGKDIHQIDEKFGGGYDHCFVTHAEEKEVVPFGKITAPETGISLEIETNQRGVQVYTGNFLKGIRGKQGVIQEKYDGICFEAQRFPDSVNHPEFPDSILRPGQVYDARTVYRFSAE